jgi:hypothetical protein
LLFFIPSLLAVYTKATWWDSVFELQPAAAPGGSHQFGGAVAIYDTLAVVAHTGINRLSLFRRNATGQWPLLHTINTTPNPLSGKGVTVTDSQLHYY